MAFENITDALHTTSKKTQAYINNTAEYNKLRLFKATVKYTSSMIFGLLLALIVTVVFLFLLIGTALWINSLLQSTYAGFFIIGGSLSLLLVFVFLLAKKQITKKVLLFFSELLHEPTKPPSKSATKKTL